MSTVAVTVNGQPAELAPATTVAALVADYCTSERGVAVAIDREVVPRSAWATREIGTGARVEIVTAVAGG